MGSITAFFAATSGLVQNDIKRIVAFSTISQLGYMVSAIGISQYNVALFHLVNHSLRKSGTGTGTGTEPVCKLTTYNNFYKKKKKIKRLCKITLYARS